jgi:outer membrane receptor protein involved in Fe transport
MILLPLLLQTLSVQSPATSDRAVIDVAGIVREHGAQSITEVLAGRAAGLLIIPGSGLTGGGSQIRFAARNTVLGIAAPLILLDGIRIDAAEDATALPVDGPGPLRLDDINVEDVESIEVLRAPASVALYGPGAAAGVILIQMKRATTGPLRWETYGRVTVSSPSGRWPTNYGGVDTNNTDPRMRAGYCALTNQAAGQCVQDYAQSFNPLAARSPFGTPLHRRAGFSASGGRPWGAVHLSGDLDGDGSAYAMPVLPINANGYSGANLRASATARPVSFLEIGAMADHVRGLLGLPLYEPVRDALLGPSDSAAFSWDSLGALYRQLPRTQQTTRTVWALSFRADPVHWLHVQGQRATDAVTSEDEASSLPTQRQVGRRYIRQRTTQLSATAVAVPWPKTRFTTTLGTERLGYRLELDQRTYCGSSNPCASSLSARWRTLTAWYLTEDVALGERFSASASVRRDAFTNLVFHNTSGGVAVSWLARPSEHGVLGRLQLRAAYGSAISVPAPAHETSDIFPWVMPPERTKGFEVGAASGLFGGRVNAQVSVYDSRSTVNRYAYYGPGVPGPISTYIPDTKLSNRGIAASFAGSVVERPGFGWTAQLSLWGNRNRVTSGSPALSTMPGYPAGGYWARSLDNYADVNGDGIIVASEVTTSSTLKWAGTPYPTQGAALTSSWRVGARWHASLMLDYRAGQSLFNAIGWWRCGGLPVCRQRYDRSTPLGQQAIAVAGMGNPVLQYYEDADYLKLREIAIAFDVPRAAAALIGARAASITLAGRNLATWTRYSGGDPEAGGYEKAFDSLGLSPPISDAGIVPLPRSWSLGVRLAF